MEDVDIILCTLDSCYLVFYILEMQWEERKAVRIQILLDHAFSADFPGRFLDSIKDSPNPYLLKDFEVYLTFPPEWTHLLANFFFVVK